ncbi:methyltransferase domain-containing protein [Ginsengibacter hankyongi]|uniref:Methyltransferase domain-containing protein n=1 Tax=Ginsengibacter hankyongi TaxID=2607284 RepID=A0A5J5IGK9_9BACT|nr:methyltransferase domain-containing protein [Ginsengibacter hankyongi]KAA9036384.1 methyltransferase domain-containing protein [Ginsengibacter hankyongi]
MKYLNLGCGVHYSAEKEWTNIDFHKTGESVIAYNLLKGIPFEDRSFDLVYHSHVLEHFSKDDGEKMITECLRVLKPGGTIRVVVPDLERIAADYLKSLNEALTNSTDEVCKANHEWMIIEMYDQFTRSQSGGNMGKYLYQDVIINEDFVFNRIGEEGKSIRTQFIASKKMQAIEEPGNVKKGKSQSIRARLKDKINKYLIKKLEIDETALRLGKFRLGGEVHQWMYDRYSISNLLLSKGGKNIKIRDAFTSYIDNWADYNIDGSQNIVRKPDSLFIEAVK